MVRRVSPTNPTTRKNSNKVNIAEVRSKSPCNGVGGLAQPAEPRVWALVVVVGTPVVRVRGIERNTGVVERVADNG
jgi:hypothetical protein